MEDGGDEDIDRFLYGDEGKLISPNAHNVLTNMCPYTPSPL